METISTVRLLLRRAARWLGRQYRLWTARFWHRRADDEPPAAAAVPARLPRRPSPLAGAVALREPTDPEG